jgi:small subunit ribosomal protein S6
MRNNIYESAVLINAALDDEQINPIIERIRETITSNGGEIREMENWGRKRLAYTVKKSKTGYYVIFRFSAPTNLISKLDRFYSLDEYILRYLTIRLDNDALEQLEKNKNQASKETEITPAIEIPAAVETNKADNVG